MCNVYIIGHLYVSVPYNHEKVNLRFFNAYKRHKAKDENSPINSSKTVKFSVNAINLIYYIYIFKYKKYMKNICILSL